MCGVVGFCISSSCCIQTVLAKVLGGKPCGVHPEGCSVNKRRKER